MPTEKDEKKGWLGRFRRNKPDVSAPQTSNAQAPEPQAPEPQISEPQAPEPQAPEPQISESQISKPQAPEPQASEPQASESQTPEQTVSHKPVPNQAAPQQTTATAPAETSWFNRLKAGLKRSSSALSDGISGIFTKAKLDAETLEELEDLLITTDLGVSVAAKLTSTLSDGRYDKEISGEDVKNILAGEIEAMLTPVAKPLDVDKGCKPHVILMAGVNGAGKTTTIGKLAKKYKDQGKSVMLAAGDTFRAAAVEQLQIWGTRTGVPVVTKEIGADAAALAYEALDRAMRENVDILFIDTAGRLQNRDELMAELAKVIRVIGKKLDGAPHDTVIILDATTGQNALHQVEVFQRMASISGIIMTKLDGSARGGVLVACADKFSLPVHAIGVGESVEDLQPFNPRDFARMLVGL